MSLFTIETEQRSSGPQGAHTRKAWGRPRKLERLTRSRSDDTLPLLDGCSFDHA